MVPVTTPLGHGSCTPTPDLISLLRSPSLPSCREAPDLSVTAAYGVPLLASEGVAAVVALGMDWLAVLVDELPPGIEADDEPAPECLSVAEGWQTILAWQDSQALRDLVSTALARAPSLALLQAHSTLTAVTQTRHRRRVEARAVA